MPPFSITSLSPTEHADVWTAAVEIRLPDEKVSGIEIAHVADMRVRFAVAEDQSVSKMLDTLHTSVGSALERMADMVRSTSLAEFRAQARAELAALNDFTFSEAPGEQP